MGCFDDVAHENIDFCPNEEISAGTSTRGFYVPAAFLETMTLPATTGDYEADITIPAGNISLSADKGWKGIDLQVDESELKSTLVGNRGNKKSKGQFDCYIPGFRPKVIGFLDKYKNVPLVFVIPDSNGVKWVIGTKLNPAYIESAEGTTGKKYEDNSGVQTTIAANSKLHIYAGDIVETADE